MFELLLKNKIKSIQEKTPSIKLLESVFNKNWGGRIRTSEMAGPKPAALPLGDVPSQLL